MPHRPPHALRATADQQARVESLTGRRPRVGLAGVLADLDRVGEPAAVPGEAAGDGFTWDARDRHDPRWWPQGMACLRGGQVLLVAWYAKRRWLVVTEGSRVSVVDRTDPDRPRYRHVRLVRPRGRWSWRRLARVAVHAGGIAVVDGLLYVADTRAGVRVFRLDDVLRVPRRREYDYVLPQLVRLRVPRGRGAGRLRWSFLFVGDVAGERSLVVGKYGRKGSAPRLARYALDATSGLPVTAADGSCEPLEVHAQQPLRMQGVAVHGETWWVSASAGEGNSGDLHVGAPGAFRRHRGVLPTGPEDLDWSRPGEELWCATEWPGRRWVFPIDARRWAGSPG